MPDIDVCKLMEAVSRTLLVDINWVSSPEEGLVGAYELSYTRGESNALTDWYAAGDEVRPCVCARSLAFSVAETPQMARELVLVSEMFGVLPPDKKMVVCLDPDGLDTVRTELGGLADYIDFVFEYPGRGEEGACGYLDYDHEAAEDGKWESADVDMVWRGRAPRIIDDWWRSNAFYDAMWNCKIVSGSDEETTARSLNAMAALSYGLLPPAGDIVVPFLDLENIDLPCPIERDMQPVYEKEYTRKTKLYDDVGLIWDNLLGTASLTLPYTIDLDVEDPDKLERLLEIGRLLGADEMVHMRVVNGVPVDDMFA